MNAQLISLGNKKKCLSGVLNISTKSYVILPAELKTDLSFSLSGLVFWLSSLPLFTKLDDKNGHTDILNRLDELHMVNFGIKQDCFFYKTFY